ncbi:ATP-binding protein [Corynebacterium vitaeruminis]|uniref:ATP-binding protein n=1 Tax=Corynebacterium vitaeruminis TaxID=38305 RepID=UPI00054EBE3C|nr:ATP-binding protein [Corynebacterium vitaeruminis]
MAVDRLAARSLRLSIRSGQQAILNEFRTRFLGYLHDEVLAYLHGVDRGVSNAKELDELLESTSRLGEDPGSIALSTAIEGWAKTLTTIDPGARFSFPHEVASDLLIPTNVASTILEASMEALSNCVEHAPLAQHEVLIEVTGSGGCLVTISDDGPGFDVGGVAHDRAEIRIAIVGRMTALAGGSAKVISAPGRGTTIEVRWENEGTASSTELLIPSAFEMLGVNKLLRPMNLLLVIGFMVALSASAWPVTNWGFYGLSIIILVIAVAAIFQGQTYFLEPMWTWVAAVSIGAFIAVSPLSMTQQTEHWPILWYLWAFGLVCAWLTMRGRAVVAWSLVGFGVLSFTVEGHLGVLDYPVDARKILSVIPLMIASSLIPTLARKATAHVPALWADYSDDQLTSGLAMVRSSFAENAGQWIAAQLRAVVSTADPVASSRLLERRLRDCIRCPLFDNPETTEAVWTARSRGATVTLLDDRGVIGEEPRYATLLSSLRAALGGLEAGGTLTARINPEGRKYFATLLWQNNETSGVERQYI